MGILITAFPLWVAFVASTLPNQAIAQAPMTLLPGGLGPEVYQSVFGIGGNNRSVGTPVGLMMWNSLLMAVIIAVGKIIISLMSAYAIVFFRIPFRTFFFWMIFVTLMLPVEVRIIPTLKVVTDLGMLNTMAGLTIPLIASATATLLFRQFFLTIPDELVEAAKIDNAGPVRFFFDVVVPLSVTTIAALFVILFIYGWNQYLWPLLITTDQSMTTIVIGITKMIDTAGGPTDWNRVMATAVLALLPPVLVVVLLQKWFVKGLVETEK
ncbi:MAG: sn-glycerol-3-phosphate ABC transporter permease UgpE [Hyphomonas sp.]|nr:sn-glycerol-3-phosphate ABC transporter permease UgpE [Hyphomonas sp.]